MKTIITKTIRDTGETEFLCAIHGNSLEWCKESFLALPFRSHARAAIITVMISWHYDKNVYHIGMRDY